MKMITMPSILVLIAFLLTPAHATWQERKAEGWAWYEEREQPKKDIPEDQSQVQSSSQELQQIRDNLEERLSSAILDPNPENVLAYMQEQRKWIEHSSDFAQVWTQILLSNPYLDYTVTSRPVSQYGLQIHNQSLQERKETLIASLAKDYGLFFFYEGENPASQFFGGIVQELSKKYGLNTIAISMDGSQLKDFNHTKQDNGIAQTLGVDLSPALYLINPKEDVAVPISFGLVAMDQIENNIVLQFKDQTEAENG